MISLLTQKFHDDKDQNMDAVEPVDTAPSTASIPPILPERSLQRALQAASDEDARHREANAEESAMSVSDADKDMKPEQEPNRDKGEMGTPLPSPVSEPNALATSSANGDRTQLVRGMQAMTRSNFSADPVVGWFVVIGGPGLGSFKPVYEGNNTVGRSGTQRVAINFGDDAISAEEQFYIRYDSSERRFLFVPNLAKTNVVSVNDEKPTGAVPLQAMDVVTVGRTQLVFVPFCGEEFDWSELTDLKGS